MTGIFKDKLIFDPSSLECSDNVGVWVRDGYNGDLVSSTKIIDGNGYALNVSIFGGDGYGVTTTADSYGHISLDVNVVSDVNDPIHVTLDDTVVHVVVDNADAADGYWYQEGSVFGDGVDMGIMALAVDPSGNYKNLSVGTDGYLLVDFARPVAVTLDEPLQVDVDIDAYFYSEDTAHNSGDWGNFVLAVRNDTKDALSGNDGDYTPFQTDQYGQLRVVADLDPNLVNQDGYLEVYVTNPTPTATTAVDCSSLATSANDGDSVSLVSDLYRRLYVNDSPNIGIANNQVDVTDTATQLVASSLDSRRRIMIQNISDCPVYLGGSGVTTSDGIAIRGGSTFAVEAGPCIDIYAVAPTGKTIDVRVFEIG
jgi:hypothetical protein